MILDLQERPGEFPSQRAGIGPQGADRGIGNVTRFQLAVRGAVDAGSLGHVGQCQPLPFSLGPKSEIVNYEFD